MKKLMILTFMLISAITACDAKTVQAPAEESKAVQPTAQVVVVTVEVTAIPTQAPPTPLSFDTPEAIPTQVPATQEPATQEPATTAEPVSSGAQSASGSFNIAASLNGGVFENISASDNSFSLRCSPREISFDLYATDIYITQVDLYYRIRDKHSNFIPGWSRAAALETDGGNHFWLTYSGESVKPDNRIDPGWFDFEFIGMNKYGDVVGRTKKIEGLVTYTINCP